MSDDVEKTVKESIDKVEEILNPEKFDLVKAIKGRTYPEDDITVFVDQEAAYDLARVNAQLSEISSHTERDEEVMDLYKELEAEAEDLRQRIIDSSIRVYMRGIPQPVYDDIVDEIEADPAVPEKRLGHEVNVRTLAKVIYKLESPGTSAQEGEFDPEQIETLYEALGSQEWDRLCKTLQGIMFAATYFDEAVNAGFLSRR